MSIQPEGEQLRKAVKWISEELQIRKDAELSKLIEEACVEFDISPKDEEFLMRFFIEKGQK